MFTQISACKYRLTPDGSTTINGKLANHTFMKIMILRNMAKYYKHICTVR